MSDCEALEEFPSRIRTYKALEGLQFNGCKSLRKIAEGWGVDLFEEIAYVALRGFGGIPFWNMYSQGFGGILIQRMQILKENTGGVNLFEDIAHVGLRGFGGIPFPNMHS